MIRDEQAAVDAWMAEAGMLPTEPIQTTNTSAVMLDDSKVLDLAFRATNGDAIRNLYNGDTTPYNGDDSAADMALARYLAFYCGSDPAQIERLMRSSKLARSKWDERRPGGTYLTQTIGHVLKDQTEFYRPPASRTPAGTTLPARPHHEPATWTFQHLSELAETGTSAVEWIIEGILGRRYKTLMPGVWKSGKTTLEAHYIRTVGMGETFCNLKVTPGFITVISEEQGALWVRRCDAVGIDRSADYVDFLCRPFPMGRPTMDQWTSLIATVSAHVRETSCALVVFDSIHNLWGIEQENDNAEQLRWLGPLDAITEAGAALLLTGHPSKADQAEGKATRGGGAIAGMVDIITEFRRYDAMDSANRMRVLMGFSRFEETPAELVLELTEDGEYRAVGTKAEVRAAKRNDEMLAMLKDDWASPEAVRDAWPGEKPPSERTIKRWLNVLVTNRQAERTGQGKKNDPHLYRRPPK